MRSDYLFRRVLPLALLAATLLLGCAQGLSAHGNMFGKAPRAMWNKAGQFELRFDNERFARIGEGGSTSTGNPDDFEVRRLRLLPYFHYGVTRDFTVKAQLPFTLAHRSTKDGSDDPVALNRLQLAFSYHLDKLLFGGVVVDEGVNYTLRGFANLNLPTSSALGSVGLPRLAAREGAGGLRSESIGADFAIGDPAAIGTRLGLVSAYSSTSLYFWSEASVQIESEDFRERPTPLRNGGIGANGHLVLGYRLTRIRDTSEAEWLVFGEFDADYFNHAAFASRLGERSELRVGAGSQYSFKEIYEFRIAAEYPVLNDSSTPRLIGSGRLVLAFSYLF